MAPPRRGQATRAVGPDNSKELRCAERSYATGRYAGCSLLHDILLHWRQEGHELLLFLRRHLELVQGLAEVFHERVEILARDAHAGVRALHVAAAVFAGSAGRLADLLDQTGLELRDVSVGEERVDALVGGDIGDEVVDHGLDRILSAEPLVEALGGRTFLLGMNGRYGEHHRNDRGSQGCHDATQSHGYPPA